MTRTRFRIALVFSFAALLSALGSRAAAGILEGVVKGSALSPKKYVRIVINGPVNKVTFTDQHARFKVDVPDGTYLIQVQERNRSMQFDAECPSTREYILNWK
jgi:hypothetical protein